MTWHAATPPLHSFPTRRSSDLVSPMPSFVMLRTADRRKSCGVSPVYVPYRPFFLALSPVLSSLPNPARSEEHTSELQSHVNLVCRLLLEKKKPRPAPHPSVALL